MSGPGKETPNAAPQGQPTQPAGGGSTAQATAAVSNAVSIVRQRLVAGEQLVLAAAAVIVLVVYLLFQFLLDHYVLSEFTVVLAVLTILAIWIHRWGHYDFGKGYRILIGALGLSLALFAVINFLAWLRAFDFSIDLGQLIYWVSGIAAGYGAWLVFRIRED